MTAWFRPRRYGHGATPTTWQGWALIVGFVAALIAPLWVMIGFDRDAPSAAGVAIYLVWVAILVVGLIFISKRKTDGEWRWRWGDKEQERQ